MWKKGLCLLIVFCVFFSAFSMQQDESDKSSIGKFMSLCVKITQYFPWIGVIGGSGFAYVIYKYIRWKLNVKVELKQIKDKLACLKNQLNVVATKEDLELVRKKIDKVNEAIENLSEEQKEEFNTILVDLKKKINEKVDVVDKKVDDLIHEVTNNYTQTTARFNNFDNNISLLQTNLEECVTNLSTQSEAIKTISDQLKTVTKEEDLIALRQQLNLAMKKFGKAQEEIDKRLEDLRNGQQETNSILKRMEQFGDASSKKRIGSGIRQGRLSEMNCIGIQHSCVFLPPITQMYLMTQRKLLTNSSEEQ